MRAVLSINKKYYLHELRQQLGSFSDLWSERFTGIILGNFIYVTHHAGFEWNRRITNEKSRAIGFVTKHGDGCVVNVILSRGYLEPLWMSFFYLLGLLPAVLDSQVQAWHEIPRELHIWALVFSAIMGISSYIQCWFTERGQYSMRVLIDLLRDPVCLWSEE